jgi:hypothetical protein
MTCEGDRQLLPSLISIYTRRAVKKVRAGNELSRQEVGKNGTAKKRVALIIGLRKKRMVNK